METIFSSERMNFIKPKESFAEFYAENINNPEIYRWLRSNPQMYTVEEEREWIKSIQGEPIYTMIDKETGDIVGNFGYNSINDTSGEIGIWITPKYQNNHYGREAIMRLIEYGFKEMNLDSITLTVFENNVRAVKCYRGIGFVVTSIDKDVTDGIGTPTNNIHMILKKEGK